MNSGILETLERRLASLERRIGMNEFEREMLVRLERLEQGFTTLGDRVMAAIDDLVTQVAETKGVTDAAVVLIQGLRDQINALVADATELEALKAQLTDLANQLDDSEQKLAGAVATPPPPA